MIGGDGFLGGDGGAVLFGAFVLGGGLAVFGGGLAVFGGGLDAGGGFGLDVETCFGGVVGLAVVPFCGSRRIKESGMPIAVSLFETDSRLGMC
jgi:hypothetical protein